MWGGSKPEPTRPSTVGHVSGNCAGATLNAGAGSEACADVGCSVEHVDMEAGDMLLVPVGKCEGTGGFYSEVQPWV